MTDVFNAWVRGQRPCACCPTQAVVGAYGGPTFGERSAKAVGAVTSNAIILKALSPPARASIESAAISMAEAAGVAASAIESVSPQALDNAYRSAAAVVKDVFSDPTVREMAQGAAEIAGAALDAVPVVAQMIGIVQGVFDAAYAIGGKAHGLGASSDVEADRAAWCQGNYYPVIGTGPGNSVLPADLFAEQGSMNAYGEKGISSIGYVLRMATEPDEFGIPIKELRRVVQAVKSARWLPFYGSIQRMRTDYSWSDAISNVIIKGGAASVSRLSSPKLGVPKEFQAVFKELRLAIASMHNPHVWTDKSVKAHGDGGALLMPVYIDMCRLLWSKGYMDDDGKGGSNYLRLMCEVDGSIINPSVKSPGETCFTHEHRGYDGATSMVVGWDQTVNPLYEQFKNTARSEEELIKAVQERAAIALGKKPKPRLRFGHIRAPYKKFSYAKAAGWSVALGIASKLIGWW